MFDDFDDPYWPLLSEVKRPSRYVGSEWGAGLPVKENATVRFCLAFPDVYEIGMSYVGYQILYPLIKSLPGADVERAYCPWTDMEQQLRSHNLPLTSLETRRSLSAFDVVGFTLQYELSYTNILTMLDLGRIPLFADERSDDAPLVIAGGPGAMTPEPVAPFFDVICIGDGEVTLPALVSRLVGTTGRSRSEKLDALSDLPGVYLPGRSHAEFGPDGCVIRSSQPLPIRRATLTSMKGAFVSDGLLVPSASVVHDRIPIELFRGCTRGCRFCQAGMLYRPIRERPVEEIVDALLRWTEKTGWEEIGLVSLASCDYSGLEDVMERLKPMLEQKRVKLSLPSLRMDAFSVGLAAALEPVRRGGLTFAPEAGTQRLRNVINKGVSDEDIESTLEAAFSRGWERIKLYFMMGLPTETREDLEGIAKISERAAVIGRKHKKRAEIAVSVAGFVPKPHTPFQWERQATVEELSERGRFVKRLVNNRHVTVRYHESEQTWLEGVFARGDRRLAGVIHEAWKTGARFDGWTETFRPDVWRAAFVAKGVDPDWYVRRERTRNESFPWDHIESGVTRDYLWRERERSMDGLLTPDCRFGECHACGWERNGCAVFERKAAGA